jgi:hypothetical protein
MPHFFRKCIIEQLALSPLSRALAWKDKRKQAIRQTCRMARHYSLPGNQSQTRQSRSQAGLITSYGKRINLIRAD